MHLANATLISLSGYRQPSAIARWLKANGFIFVMAADGWPRVALSHYEARMNGEVKRPGGSLNLGALKGIQNGKTKKT